MLWPCDGHILAESSVIVLAKDVQSRHADGSLFLIDGRSGNEFGVNAVAEQVISLLRSPCSIENLISSIESDYRVGRDTVSDDVARFLCQLLSLEIIDIVNQ